MTQDINPFHHDTINTLEKTLVRLCDRIQKDHEKIQEHSVASLKEVLTTDIEHYGFDNKNISDHDVDLLLKIVGTIIKNKCRAVYHNQI